MNSTEVIARVSLFFIVQVLYTIVIVVSTYTYTVYSLYSILKYTIHYTYTHVASSGATVNRVVAAVRTLIIWWDHGGRTVQKL